MASLEAQLQAGTREFTKIQAGQHFLLALLWRSLDAFEDQADSRCRVRQGCRAPSAIGRSKIGIRISSQGSLQLLLAFARLLCFGSAVAQRAPLQEFASLTPSNTIYKQVGPVLLKQDQDEAKANVEKRLQFIAGEM